MKRISKRELVSSISKAKNIRYIDVYNTVECLLEEIKRHYLKGDIIELRGFGTFYPFFKKARFYRIPRLKKAVKMKGRTTLKFKTSKSLYIFEK